MADPIFLPSGIGFENLEFSATEPRDIARMEGRRVESVAFGTPFWTANFSTVFLEEEDVATMDAWLIQTASAGVSFLAHDIFRPRPIKENTGVPLGSGATANLATITNSRQVAVNALPAGFQLTAGDYMTFRMSNRIRSLHMITASATANGSGSVVLKFKNDLDTQHFTTSAVVDFEKPSCVMQVIGNPRVPKGWGARRVSFQAQEVFFQ